jgi:hypothetical protein
MLGVTNAYWSGSISSSCSKRGKPPAAPGREFSAVSCMLHVLPDGFRSLGIFGFFADVHHRAKLALSPQPARNTSDVLEDLRHPYSDLPSYPNLS